MRRVILASFAVVGVVLAGGAYVAADVLDVAPGILTRDRPTPAATPTVSGSPAPLLLPTPGPSGGDAVLTASGDDAPVPTAAGLRRALTTASDDPDLRGSVGIAVGDGVTGRELWTLGGSTPRVPASTVKLMSALAIADTLDLDARMTTSVVERPGTRDLVLVARGDTLLSPGAGDPTAVLGHAGLADLADQVAAHLGGTGDVRLRLDLSWAPGPRFPATWAPGDRGLFYARPVVMTGLSTQVGEDGGRVPPDPAREVADAFAQRLEERGLSVTIRAEGTWSAPAPEDAEEVGSIESATYAEVLDHTLDESDNTLTENLVRQAAATAGEPTRPQGANAAFIRARLAAHAVPTAGLVLKDACGLSPGQAATPRTLAAVLALATTDTVPQLRRIVAALPVSGLTGTLSDRFESAATEDVAGVPRAKTGTLVTGSGLAGTTVDADGRPLTFVVLADGFPRTYDGIHRARDAIDRIVASLTRCGCRGSGG